jgi:flagella basal body P-ring formation protein FlgA
MRSSLRLTEWLLLLVVGIGSAARAAPPAGHADGETVVLTLRSSVSVGAEQVCVHHVGSLSGGSMALREKIAALDLADQPRAGQSLPLPKALIEYRIQLAGIPRERIRFEGAGVVTITRAAGTLSEEDFVLAAKESLFERLPYRPEDVAMTLMQGLRLPDVNLTAKDQVRFDADPRSPATVPGRVRVDVTLSVNGESFEPLPVVLDVKVYQSMAVVTRSVGAGTLLSEENVRFERRLLEAPAVLVTSKDLKAGRKTKWALTAGQVVTPPGIEAVVADNPVVIKAREVVKAMAKVGNLKVSAMVEAQQEGRVGELIRIRNLDSKKELVGRVVERGVVEVEY